MLSEETRPGPKCRAFGRVKFSSGLGRSVSPLVDGLIYDLLGQQVIFTMTGVLVGLAVTLIPLYLQIPETTANSDTVSALHPGACGSQLRVIPGHRLAGRKHNPAPVPTPRGCYVWRGISNRFTVPSVVLLTHLRTHFRQVRVGLLSFRCL